MEKEKTMFNNRPLMTVFYIFTIGSNVPKQACDGIWIQYDIQMCGGFEAAIITFICLVCLMIDFFRVGIHLDNPCN